MSSGSRRKTQRQTEPRGGLIPLILKQLAAALVCFAVVLAMHASKNEAVRNCADSFGRALKYDTDWQRSAESAAAWLTERLTVPKNENNGGAGAQPPPDEALQQTGGGEITFQ